MCPPLWIPCSPRPHLSEAATQTKDIPNPNSHKASRWIFTHLNFLPWKNYSLVLRRMLVGNLHSGPIISFCSSLEIGQVVCKSSVLCLSFCRFDEFKQVLLPLMPQGTSSLNFGKVLSAPSQGCFTHPCLHILQGPVRWVVPSLRGLYECPFQY